MREPRYHRMTAYDRSLLPNPHLVTLEDGVNGPDGWVARSGYSPWATRHYMVLCTANPGRRNDIIEAGTNQGASTIVLAQALKDAGVDGTAYSVAIDSAKHARARESLAQAGLTDRVELIRGDSRECLPSMSSSVQDVTVAFLDGCHLRDDVLAEFSLVHPRLSASGIVLFDNAFRIAEEREDGRVNEDIRSILDRWGGHVVNFPFCSWYTPGLAVWQRRPLHSMEPESGSGPSS